ncbi:MAG: AAA family ATPase, partial [Candidatus Heimdallarchaeaceae archaeon]
MSHQRSELVRKNKEFSQKLARIIKELSKHIKEREEVIRGSILAILANEHVLFLGPPGTAKSLLARKLCNIIKDGQYYYYLLTRFTVPEEVFGPLSLKALEDDKFSRKIDGYLPTAHIAFLDEIFKANSSILNSLLTIINERIYHNGSSILRVPLLSIFGASNELPADEENLEALYDRFLFRYDVENLKEKKNFLSVIIESDSDFEIKEKIELKEIDVINSNACQVKFS